MEINAKLLKPITEVKYLSAENCGRYRAILRYFYLQYEKIRYWMYKEEVFDALRDHAYFQSYTPELLKQDLEALVSWGNLLPMQDTAKAATVEEFKNKQFRYQLSEYSVEIERLTLKLENLFVEGASLEPSLFERIRDAVLKLPQVARAEEKDAGLWWRDLNNDFKRLNQNYQDYIRSFHSLKAEERMKTREFIVYKDALLDYLRDFVRGLQNNGYFIAEALRGLTQEVVGEVLEKAFNYEKKIPRLDYEIAEPEIRANIWGRWESFRDWFLGSHAQDSEVVRILEITNDIIRKITRYASRIVESSNSAANRKEEYKKLCGMFLACRSMDEAHRLSSLAFGLFGTRHISGDFERATESIGSGVFDEEPFQVPVRPRVRSYKEKAEKKGFTDKREKKERLVKAYIERLEQEKDILESYITGNYLDLSSLPQVAPHVRTTLLKWIARASASPEHKGRTEEGKVYTLVFPGNGERCTLTSEDGSLELPSYTLIFH